MTDSLGTIALLWRGEKSGAAPPPNPRLMPIFEHLAAVGVAGKPVVYSEETASEIREQLLAVNGVLVWVDPLSNGRDRSALDPMLREVASSGVWVSAHPDVILKMGVKEVLHSTRSLSWGTDTHLYLTPEAFRAEFPARLVTGPRVLKQNRGNGGQGVWKVELAGGEAPQDDSAVEVLHAQRGSKVEHMSLGALLDRCQIYFAGAGRLIDQPFQLRLPEGMIRCYMAEDRVVGFGRQLIKALMPPEADEPGPRIMSDANYPLFQTLRARMEREWLPGMMALLDINQADLPVIWDADFLYGPKAASGEDTFVLCEINISSVLPIPDQAPAEIARSVARRLGRA